MAGVCCFGTCWIGVCELLRLSEPHSALLPPWAVVAFCRWKDNTLRWSYSSSPKARMKSPSLRTRPIVISSYVLKKTILLLLLWDLYYSCCVRTRIHYPVYVVGLPDWAGAWSLLLLSWMNTVAGPPCLSLHGDQRTFFWSSPSTAIVRGDMKIRVSAYAEPSSITRAMTIFILVFF